MINKLVRKNIVDLLPYKPYDYDYTIKSDANESPYNLDQEIVSSIIEKIAKGDFNRYPDTNSIALRKEIGKYHNIDYEKIIVGNGSDELITITLNTFVEKSDYVLTHNPTFSMYNIGTTIIGGNYIEIPTDENFNVDKSNLIKLANEKNAKIIFLCTPNNPTGNIIEMEDIIEIIDKTKSIIIVDEAYVEFGENSMKNAIDKFERLIVLRTFSKGFGGAGIRLGYLLSNEKIVDRIMSVKAPYNLNFMTQIAGIEIIKNADSIMKQIEKIKVEREKLLLEMKQIEKIKAYNSKANFILFKVENSQEIFGKLLAKGIMVRVFGDGSLKNHIRYSIGNSEENIIFLNTLKEII